MSEKIVIFADYREASSSCFQFLKQNPLIDLHIDTLPIGDYEAGAFLFERKTLKDLSVSLIDGRLFSQMARLLPQKRPVLLVEAPSEELGNGGVSRESLQGAIITISLIYGIPVLHALNAEEAANLIFYSSQQQHALRAGHIARFGYIPKTRTKKQLYILQGLPNIGAKRAKLLLAHFGNVRAVMNAGIKALKEVDGFGKERAKAIYEILS